MATIVTMARVMREPKVEQTSNGGYYALLTVGDLERVQDRETKEWESNVYQVILFGRDAERFLARGATENAWGLGKGAICTFSGQLGLPSTWGDNNDMFNLPIRGYSVVFLPKATQESFNEGNEVSAGTMAAVASVSNEKEEIPF